MLSSVWPPTSLQAIVTINCRTCVAALPDAELRSMAMLMMRLAEKAPPPGARLPSTDAPASRGVGLERSGSPNHVAALPSIDATSMVVQRTTERAHGMPPPPCKQPDVSRHE